jgi:hypothetical protein
MPSLPISLYRALHIGRWQKKVLGKFGAVVQPSDDVLLQRVNSFEDTVDHSADRVRTETSGIPYQMIKCICTQELLKKVQSVDVAQGVDFSRWGV